MGINLAGVEMILKLKKQIKLMQKNINKLFEQANQQLEKQTEVTKQAARDNAQKVITTQKRNK